MKVYSVTEIEMTPYGEDMGEGMTYGLFLTKTGAAKYVKELQEAHRYNFTDKKDGHLRVRMPKWVVAAVEVQY